MNDVEAYIDVYVPMNRAMWRSLEKDEITREELVETRFAKLFDHFGFEKTGRNSPQITRPSSRRKGKRTKERRRCFKRYRMLDTTYTLPQTASQRFKRALVKLTDCKILQESVYLGRSRVAKAKRSLLRTCSSEIPDYDKG